MDSTELFWDLCGTICIFGILIFLYMTIFFTGVFAFFAQISRQSSLNFHIPENKIKSIFIRTLVKKAPPYCGRRVGGVRRGWLASLFAVNRPEEEEAIIREQDLVGAGILLRCRHQLAVLHTHRSWLEGQSWEFFRCFFAVLNMDEYFNMC